MSRAATVLVAWLGLWASTVAPVKGAFFSPSSLAASGVHPIDAALANSSCVVVFVPDASSNTDHAQQQASTAQTVLKALAKEPRVATLVLPRRSEQLPPGLSVFTPRPKDRSCLLAPPPSAFGRPQPASFTGLPLPRAMLAFVNQKCGVHRALDGSLNAAGRAIRRLEVRTWGASAVGSAEDLRTSDEEQISSDEEQPSSDGADVARGADPSWRVAESQVDDGKEEYTCERVDAATLTFMREYVVRSRPVVITGAASAQRFRHWNVDFFRQKLGSHTVHVKVSNTGDFEGPEPLSWWTRGGDTLQPPDAVLAQLQSPHLVLVRPAAVDLPFSEFMDRLQSANAQRQFHPTPTCGGGDGDGEGEGAGEGEGKGETERGAASAAPTCADPSVGGPTDAHVPSYYIEYLSLESYLQELHSDAATLPFGKLLRGEKRNFWFGDGRTVGKLHFDPYENLLMMVAGGKSFTLYRPHNNQDLYEGHMREAMLDFSLDTGAFHRRNLMESTSMVNSPVDIVALEKERLANASTALRSEFARHEVRSSPDVDGKNLAINSWYDPVYTKEFPCAQCPMHFNTDSYGDVAASWV